jgi:Transcription factor WhiB/MarR family
MGVHLRGDAVDVLRSSPCRHLPVEWFVPHTDHFNTRRKQVTDPPPIVTELCTICPVRRQCLDYGVETLSSGWWGGVLLHEGQAVLSTGHVLAEEDRCTTEKAAHGEPLEWLRAAMAIETDECQPWPFALTDGYPSVWIDGKGCRAHVVVCTLTHGPRPSRSTVAKHSCGPQRDCVNKRHVDWEKQPNAVTKLTLDDVREIRRLYTAGGITQYQLAERFGVGQMAVNRVVRRLTFPEVD